MEEATHTLAVAEVDTRAVTTSSKAAAVAEAAGRLLSTEHDLNMCDRLTFRGAV